MAPFQSFLEDLDVLGVKSVNSGGHRYAVFSARSNARWWLLPLDNRRAAATALEMLQPVTLAARLAKDITQMYARVGPLKLLGQGQIRLKNFSNVQELRSAFGEKAAHIACFTGTDGPHRKTALQIMDRRGAIVGYAKLSRSDRIRPFLRNEVKMLRQAKALNLGSADIPKVLEILERPNLTMIITDSIKSDVHHVPVALTPKHLEFLSEIRYKSERMGANRLLDDLSEQTSEIAGTAGPEWLARFSRVDDVLRPNAESIPLCLTHGDFTPWNTFIQNDRLYVFDWEYGESAWPVGYDLSHFALSTLETKDQETRLSTVIQTLASSQFCGNHEKAKEALLLSLACHAMFYISRLTKANRPLIEWREERMRAEMIDWLLNDRTAR